MLNALHVINSVDPKNGGTSVSVPSLMIATADWGKYSNTLLEFADEAGEKVIGPRSWIHTHKRSPVGLVLNMLVGGEVDKEIRNADVVHIHGIWQPHCITCGVVARRRRKPVIASAHGMLERWAIHNKAWKKWPYSQLVERPNLQRATILRALTLAEVDDYRRYGLTNPIAVIPNGVDILDKVSPDQFLSLWPELRGRRLVLYLSRIHYKKGVDILVKAWAGTVKQFPDAHLVIAGPDFEGTRRVVEQLVREYSIGGKVTFTGPVFGDQKASLLSAASLFVLPSHSEGFSVAVLEALAAGIPAIITTGCNFPAVAASGSGWIISPNTDELEHALREALESNAADLHNRSQLGIELVRSNYSWRIIGKQMTEVYDWMLGGSRPSSVEIFD
jgi:glycosyltransferase involved in cell wall biosynthesis